MTASPDQGTNWLLMGAEDFDDSASSEQVQEALFDPRPDRAGTPSMFDGAEIAAAAEAGTL
jgi:hypothetical protein